jgi:hypothetical protein
MSGDGDVRRLIESDGPFLTIVIPAPSRFEDSAHRFDVEWRNARRELSHEWDDEELGALDEQIAALHRYEARGALCR